LYNILIPFKKVTRDFSRNTYITLSYIILIIINLTNFLESFNKDFNNEIIIFNLKKTLTNQQINYNNIIEVLENVKKKYLYRFKTLLGNIR